MMQISNLTYLGFYLNGAHGSGKYSDITIDDVRARIEDGTIFEFLKSRLGHDLDISLFEPLDRFELLTEWQDMLCISASRKLCVDRGGLCLLVAFLLEGIQRRASDPGLRLTDEWAVSDEFREAVVARGFDHESDDHTLCG